MSDKKISELTNITGANLADTDEFVVVDTSASETKAITYGELKKINGNLSFGDNDKAIFGAGSDLQIYHDGSHSYVSDVGQGNMRILAANFELRNSGNTERMILAEPDAGVSLYYDNAAKLATTSTGVDVTGTLTADGLTVDGNATVQTSNPKFTITNTAQRAYSLNVNGTSFYLKDESDAQNIIRIDEGGDISFYEDTGTTPKFFWDASAEALGIGTSSPTAPLEVSGSAYIRTANTGVSQVLRFDRNQATTGDIGQIQFYTNDGAGNPTEYGRITGTATTINNGIEKGDLYFSTTLNGVLAERMRIDSSGNVGIGTSSPSLPLEVYHATNSRILASTGNTGASQLCFGDDADDYVGRIYYDHNGNTMRFHTNATEAMRIDSSGNLLVNKTSQGVTSSGSELGLGWVAAARSGDAVAYFNRQTNDGDIAKFYKDGTTVGSIGSVSGATAYIDGGSGFSGIQFGGDGLVPRDNGALADNTSDLGTSSYRFKDIYATNALIQTSDRNEKQDIAELDEAERRVAVAAKGLIRKFRWKDAVAEKGDDARIHFGIIAQDLQAAFEAEGLDAGRYAMFIHSTWTDEETGEERSRMGVRYSELLAFIIAAI